MFDSVETALLHAYRDEARDAYPMTQAQKLVAWRQSGAASVATDGRGLTRQDLAAQSAWVRGKVEQLLPPSAQGVIWALYGVAERTKVAGIERTASMLHGDPAVSASDQSVIKALVLMAVASNAAKGAGITLRSIASNTARSKSALGRDYQAVRRLIAQAELSALARLELPFVDAGYVRKSFDVSGTSG